MDDYKIFSWHRKSFSSPEKLLKQLKEMGFEVVLMLEATIGLNDMSAEPDESESEGETAESGAFTSHDVNFLKSLRISIEGEDDSAG